MAFELKARRSQMAQRFQKPFLIAAAISSGGFSPSQPPVVEGAQTQNASAFTNAGSMPPNRAAGIVVHSHHDNHAIAEVSKFESEPLVSAKWTYKSDAFDAAFADIVEPANAGGTPLLRLDSPSDAARHKEGITLARRSIRQLRMQAPETQGFIATRNNAQGDGASTQTLILPATETQQIVMPTVSLVRAIPYMGMPSHAGNAGITPDREDSVARVLPNATSDMTMDVKALAVDANAQSAAPAEMITPNTGSSNSEKEAATAVGILETNFVLTPPNQGGDHSAKGRANAKLAPTSRAPGRQTVGSLKSHLTGRGVEFALPVEVDRVSAGTVQMLVSQEQNVEVSVQGLLSLVAPLMDPAAYQRLQSSAAAQEFVSLNNLRASGIDFRYDAARDRLLLSTP